MLDVSKNWAARCTLILLKIQSCGARSTRPPRIPWDTWGMLCVMGVGVKFPANGFSTNNATGRQRLRTFDRTIQSCALISQGNLNSCCRYSPGHVLVRSRFPGVQFVKAITTMLPGPCNVIWLLICKNLEVTAIYHLRIGKRFRNGSSKSAADCLASWNVSGN